MPCGGNDDAEDRLTDTSRRDWLVLGLPAITQKSTFVRHVACAMPIIPAGDRVMMHCAPNPSFLPDRPYSYETILCRLGGWWTMGEATLTAREVITMKLA
jgi:hypothetical protein